MQFLLHPTWFYNIDSAFEVVSVIVTAAIALYSLRIYSFTKENRHKYFGLSFLAISIAYLCKILTNVVLYQKMQEVGGIVTVTKYALHALPIFSIFGLFSYRIFMLLGLAGIYLLLSQSRERSHIVLIVYFIVITTLFSGYAYFIFHMTAALLLMYIVGFYYQRSRQGQGKSRSLVAAFSCILISQLAFIFIFLNSKLYVLGESFQLLGFLILLYEYYHLVLRRR